MPTGRKSRKSRAPRQAKKRLPTKKIPAPRVKRPTKKSVSPVAKRRARVKKPVPPKTRKVKAVTRKAPKKKAAPKKTQKSILQNLQSAFSKLKKERLIKTKKNARKVTLKDKKAVKAVKDFAGVLSGKEKAFKVTPTQAVRFRKAGLKIVKNEAGLFLLLPQRVEKMKNGEIRSIILPVKYKSLHQFLTDAQKDHSFFESMRPKGAQWAFRFYGYNSYLTYSSLDLLLGDFERYTSVQEATSNKDRAKQREIYKNLEIVAVQGNKAWQPSEPARGKKRGKRKRTSFERDYRERLRMRHPDVYKKVLEKERQYSANRYRRMRRNPKAYRDYLRKKRDYMRLHRK